MALRLGFGFGFGRTTDVMPYTLWLQLQTSLNALYGTAPTVDKSATTYAPACSGNDPDTVLLVSVAPNTPHVISEQAAAGYAPRITKNWLLHSEDISQAVWVVVGTASKASAPVISLPNASDSIKQTVDKPATSATVTFSVKLSGTGTVSLGLSNNIDDVTRTLVTLTGTPTVFSLTKTFNSTVATQTRVELFKGTATEVTFHGEAQLEGGTVVTDHLVTTTTPNNAWHDTLLDSTPLHPKDAAGTYLRYAPWASGIAVTAGDYCHYLGSYYLATANDAVNTDTPDVAANWVEQGYYRGPFVAATEPARTNLFLNSATPATQNVTTTAQAYTIWVEGTGDVTVSGTATGTATEGSPLTVTATAGTMTCTVTGTLTHVQVEAGYAKTSKIATAGTTVTRPASRILTTGTDYPENNSSIELDLYPLETGRQQWALQNSAGTQGLYIDATNKLNWTDGTATVTSTTSVAAGTPITVKVVMDSASGTSLEINGVEEDSDATMTGGWTPGAAPSVGSDQAKAYTLNGGVSMVRSPK